jgi:hypothetical protein
LQVRFTANPAPKVTFKFLSVNRIVIHKRKHIFGGFPERFVVEEVVVLPYF